MGHFQVDNGQVKIFLICIQYSKSQRRKWCYGVGPLGRGAVGPLGRWAVREHFVLGAYLRMYLFDCIQILHAIPLGDLVVPVGYMNFELLLVQNYDIFRRFDTHFLSGADLEYYWADYSRIAHT